MSVENSFTDLVFSLSEKDFKGLQNVKLILPDHAKRSRCGRKIKRGSIFDYIDGKLYCEKCSRAKHDWDLLELFALLDDD
jgi:hypothetical protein